MVGVKACLITGSLLPWTGGPVRSVAAFQRALDADVVSFTDERYVGDDALPANRSRRVNVPSIPIPCARHFLVPTLAGLRNAYRLVADADLVSCHSFYLFHPLWLAALNLPKRPPYWFVPHGILDPVVTCRQRLLKNGYRIAARRLLANASATIFSTARERDKAVQTCRVANPVVIHWPVDGYPMAARHSARRQLRNSLRVPEDTRILIAVGRLDHLKRPLEMIRIFAACRVPDWHLVIVGPEETVTADACRETARLCGVAERVHIIAGVSHAAARILSAGADVFISYSVRENFNNAAAEALAAGVPLLLSAGNDLATEILPTGAVWILPEDRGEAGRFVARFLALPIAELQQRGEEGRVWAGRHLSFEEFRRRLLALRDDVTAGQA